MKNGVVMISGSCLCGQNRYRISAHPVDCSYCHCGICRKLSGSAFGAYGSVRRSSFVWQSSAEDLSCYSPTQATRRYFCKHCGTFLLTEHNEEPDQLFLSLGALDETADILIEYHQFVSHKAHWHKNYPGQTEFSRWPHGSSDE